MRWQVALFAICTLSALLWSKGRTNFVMVVTNIERIQTDAIGMTNVGTEKSWVNTCYLLEFRRIRVLVHRCMRTDTTGIQQRRTTMTNQAALNGARQMIHHCLGLSRGQELLMFADETTV